MSTVKFMIRRIIEDGNMCSGHYEFWPLCGWDDQSTFDLDANVARSALEVSLLDEWIDIRCCHLCMLLLLLKVHTICYRLLISETTLKLRDDADDHMLPKTVLKAVSMPFV